MYICICNGVTDSDIKQCLRAGAASLADLRDRLGVATNCGRCAQASRSLLREHVCTSAAPADAEVAGLA